MCEQSLKSKIVLQDLLLKKNSILLALSYHFLSLNSQSFPLVYLINLAFVFLSPINMVI